MNCRQAREMLAAYRDLKNEQTDTTELEIHLATCADCRQQLDQYNLLGRRIRALPRIDAASGTHTRLMQALAKEHALYLQRNTASTQARSVPEFLVPYLQQQATPHTDALTAFSTAKTGPLPVITLNNKRRHRPRPFTQFGIIGLAAVFLMLLMTGGLTTMLILAGGKPVSIQPASINIQQSQVTPNLYNTDTPFTHIVSGVADSDAVYYTAYDNQANWMLEKLDTRQQGQQQQSVPLLSTTSTNPLVVLGSANNWVIWLQLGTPKTITPTKSQDHTAVTHLIRTWSLRDLYLGTDNQYKPGVSQTLLSDSFNDMTAPVWTHTPIQGIWFLKNTLLITYIDAKGISHLDQYNLQTNTNTTLATSTTDGHVFTSPTANADGTNIYWDEEWQTSDNVLHGNIWTQQIRNASPSYGRWQPHPEANTFLLRNDETSFHPQVINNMLFLLSTSTSASSAATIRNIEPALLSPTPTSDALTTPTPAPTDAPLPMSITPRVDPQIYGPQADTALQGQILAFKLGNNSSVPLPPALSDKVATLQGGSRFLLYQNSNGNVGLYDTLLGQALTIVNTVKNATFLAVNNETAVWIADPQENTTTTITNLPENDVQINMFTLTIKMISKTITKMP
ncbi:MAG TPA: hypothetical protein VL485_27175 [Ktedonobacteraceae bacterium]|nr:hypothetical protein [Ktedonobacteraceae bacterium]